MSYFEKANDLYSSKEYEKAINLYKKSLQVKENECASLYNAAVCYIKLKKYDKAIPLLKVAISVKSDSRYFFNLGYCYSALKDKRKALIYFNTAWALDHSDDDCKKAIDLILNSYKKKYQ